MNKKWECYNNNNEEVEKIAMSLMLVNYLQQYYLIKRCLRKKR